MIENKDYTFVESDKSDFYSVRLISGDYADIVFRIDNVSLNEVNDELHLKYDYAIESEETELENDKDFGKIVGDIITKLLTHD